MGLCFRKPQSIMIATTTRGLFVDDMTGSPTYARRRDVKVTIKIMRRASLARTRTPQSLSVAARRLAEADFFRAIFLRKANRETTHRHDAKWLTLFAQSSDVGSRSLGRAGQGRITRHDPMPARSRQELPTQIGHPIWRQPALHRPVANLRFPGVHHDGKADPAVITPDQPQE